MNLQLRQKQTIILHLARIYRPTADGKLKALTQWEFENFLLVHQELERKESAAVFLPGALRSDRRKKG
jgi:hypothetical protein